MKKMTKYISIFFIVFIIILVPSNVFAEKDLLSIIEESELKACLEYGFDQETCEKATLKITRNSNNSDTDPIDISEDTDCEYIFGDPNNEDSVIYMMQRFFDYVKVIAPLLVVLLSGFDFAKITLSGDQDQMKKATSKLVIRLVCAVALYFVPMITTFLLNLINNSSVDQTCGLK